jgi:nucleoid DNA-binding protein
MEFNGLPGIEEYLASRANGYPIDISELDHISEAIVAYCGFNKDQSRRVLSLFFQEIRTFMLSGQSVDIRGFGSFFISSPKVTSNTKKVFPKFKCKKSLSKRLNNG